MISNGIDMIEISRIEKAIESESFLKKVYGEREISYLKNKKSESYAAAFCGKEAFSKALGTGVRGFALNEVEVLHEENGKPYLFLSGNAKRIAEEKRLKFSISISHTREFAIAEVIAYTEGQNV